MNTLSIFQKYMVIITLFIQIPSCCDESAIPPQTQEPLHIVYNAKLDVYNNNQLKTESDCLCTFSFGQQMKDCIVQLSDDQLNQELKTYKDKRLKVLWRMLNSKQRDDLLAASDEIVYQRIYSIDNNIPRNKAEFIKILSSQELTLFQRTITTIITGSAYLTLRIFLS